MIKVPQEDPAGCAIASVACTLYISYQEAKKLFEKPHRALMIGYSCEEIIKALKGRGFDYSFARAEGNEEFIGRQRSIVFIKPNRKISYWALPYKDPSRMDESLD